MGEAPGFAEDVLGEPFVSTAGDKLELIIELVNDSLLASHCITNIVCCVPKDEDKPGKVRPPTEEEAYACSDRLAELILACDPTLIVCLGEVALAYLEPHIDIEGRGLCHVDHPAAIARSPEETQAWKIHDAAATIITAYDQTCHTEEVE